MKSLLVFFTLWGAAFAPIGYVAHRMFLGPADWIASLIVALFFALGVNGLRRARLERKDANLVAHCEGATLGDGRRVAVVGTIQPELKTLTAPLSGRECLAYDYEIGHYEAPSSSSSSSARSSEVIDFGGYGLTPSVIHASIRQVRLNGFPGLEGFPKTEDDELDFERARRYVATTPFERQSLWLGIAAIDKLANDRSGSLRLDWRMTSHEGLDGSFLREKILPVGAQACVIGRYSEQDAAIVPERGWGGVRVIRGNREEGLQFLRDKFTGTWIASLLFLCIPGPIAFAGLSHQESYAEAHNQTTRRSELSEALHAAVAAEDVAAVREAIWWGADANMRNVNGYVALSQAQHGATAAALIAAGADVDAKDRQGRTPLMWAVYYGKPEVVRVLVANHARLDETAGPSGDTALAMALAENKNDIAAILREAGARE